ncbi:MAG TPA: S-adenosylmethionine:tRNA ribosyltransferase-isomerase [Ktedonobacterales bacterium]|nr:S-adenosylmethionine:tRNA ribosyltransferase-isomerase [Ktedonobacterales bacterium]
MLTYPDIHDLEFMSEETHTLLKTLDFTLPPELEAREPAEARGLARDEVRLMVSSRATDCVAHTRFRAIGTFLRAGDTLVINTSGTMNAALPATRPNGQQVELHLSTRLPADLWVVELRQPVTPKKNSLADPKMIPAAGPFREDVTGETLTLPAEGSVTLHTPYALDDDHRPAPGAPVRLWVATLRLREPLQPYLARYGAPIRYSYVPRVWPSRYYQTVYATEVGSAEAPSAGLAFTPEVITQLVAQGVRIAPLLLHTGVSSLEEHEPPYEEYYRVPTPTASLVNLTREEGGRVIAVGTTVVRALETVADARGTIHPGEGWTRLVVTPQRGMRGVQGLLTGLHEPRASHLAMLAALASEDHLRIAYTEALRERYLWHEFGDLHLLLP